MPDMDIEYPKEFYWEDPEPSQWMLDTARKITRNPHKAEDLRQDAYIKMWKSPRQKFCRKHVITIMKNCWRDELRREKRNKEKLKVLQEILSVGLLQPGAPILDHLQLKEAVEALAHAIRALPPADREILELRYLSDPPHSVKETAAILGISESAAKVRISRALQRLRQKLVPPSAP